MFSQSQIINRNLRLLYILIQVTNYQKRLPPTSNMGCSAFFHMALMARWKKFWRSTITSTPLRLRYRTGICFSSEPSCWGCFFFFFFGMRYAMTSSWLWCHVSLKKLTYKVCAVGGAVCLSKWPFKKKQCRPCSTAWTRIMTMSLLIASSWQLLCRRFQEGKWENRNQSENIRRYNRINLSPIMSQLCHIYIIFYTLTEYI